jgi:ligand-binding SRPBCC domain-containing protein
MITPPLQLDRTQLVPLPLDEAFAFYADASNLEAITPPWLRFRFLTPAPIVVGEGTLIDYRLALHGVPMRWRTRIERWQPARCFVDRQIEGPFALWEHTHTFEEHPGGTLIRDRVEYRMPLGAVGRLAHGLLIGRDLDRIFDYRRTAVAELLGSRRAPRRADDDPVESTAAVRCG